MYKKSRSQLYGYPSISMRVRRSLSINSNSMANRPACWYVAENIGSLEKTWEYGSTLESPLSSLIGSTSNGILKSL
jgi:hypothetical protein